MSAAPHSSGVAKETFDSFIVHLQCDISVIEELSKEYGYGDQWTKFEPKYKQALDNANKCIELINGDEDKLMEYVSIICDHIFSKIKIYFKLMVNLSLCAQFRCTSDSLAEILGLNFGYFTTINDGKFLIKYTDVSVEKCGQ